MSTTTRMLREPAVLEAKGGGRSKLWEDVREGRFPKPVKIGARAVAWFEDEVAAYQDRLRATRDAK